MRDPNKSISSRFLFADAFEMTTFNRTIPIPDFLLSGKDTFEMLCRSNDDNKPQKIFIREQINECEKRRLKMEPVTVGFLAILILLVLLALGFHIAVCMGTAGIIGFSILMGWQPAMSLAASQAFAVCSNYSYSVIPLFMLMGLIVFSSGLANYIYEAMYRWFGRLPGGLMIATTAAAGVFAAASGSSIAGAVTFAKISVPEMIKRKYHGGLACGSVAAAGAQSALIPPSGLMVLYAIITEQSIGKCLMAGLLPGILSNFLFIVMVFSIAIYKPVLLPRGPVSSMKQKVDSLKMAWPAPLIVVLVLGGLYLGVFTPSEAAGIGVFLAFLVALFTVGLKKINLGQALRQTLSATVMIFTILIGAFIFGSFLAISRLPAVAVEFVTISGIDRIWVLLLILLILLIMGTFMSSTAMVVLIMPVAFPVIVSLGYDPIWFAVITIKMVEVGVITPPVGLNVYAVKGAVGDAVSLVDIFKGIVPFLIMDFITIGILIAFPSISLLLPNAMAG